ncbi:MAG: Replication factor C small subunit, partial [Candidatus Nanohaloarchaea archaeon]
DGQDVLKAIHREIFDLDISEAAKLELIREMGEYEFRIIEGGSPDVQIESFLAQVANLDG